MLIVYTWHERLLSIPEALGRVFAKGCLQNVCHRWIEKSIPFSKGSPLTGYCLAAACDVDACCQNCSTLNPPSPARPVARMSITSRVLHAHDLVGDSVEDMLVLLTSDAFQPPEASDSGATAASFSSG